MSDDETFQVRVHGEQEVRTLTVKTGKYQMAAAAAPAIFGLDLPVDLEIWCERHLPEYGPYHYRVQWNKFVCVEVQLLLPPRS
jgi:hypothetical protein